MSTIKRIILFVLALVCWGLAVSSAAFWLRARIELEKVRKNSQITMYSISSGGKTVFAAEIDMDYCKWRYQRGVIRLLLSAPDGVHLRNIIASHDIEIHAGGKTGKIQLENAHEPYHFMREHAKHPSNNLLLSSDLSYAKGKNKITLTFSPMLPKALSLNSILFFQDGELTSVVVIKGLFALFFLGWAILQTILFFYSERTYSGRLHRFFYNLFWLVPIEIILAVISLVFWKAWLYGLRPDSLSGFILPKFSHSSPGIMFQRFFLELNILLFLLLFTVLLLYYMIRRIRRKKHSV